MWSLAKTSAVTDGSITLGVAVGSRQFIAAQVSSAQCASASSSAILCESLGVGRINHILRVHGHIILEEQRAAEVYDEIGQ